MGFMALDVGFLVCWKLEYIRLLQDHTLNKGAEASLINQRYKADVHHIRSLSNRLLNHFVKCEHIFISCTREHCVSGILNISFAFV